MAGMSSGAGGCPSSRPRAASATAAAGVTSPPPWLMRAQEQEAAQVPVPMAEHAGERVSAAARASALLPRPTTCYACSPCPGSQPPSRVLSPISGCSSNTSSSSSSTAASSRRTSVTSAARSSRNATLWTLLQAHRNFGSRRTREVFACPSPQSLCGSQREMIGSIGATYPQRNQAYSSGSIGQTAQADAAPRPWL